MKKLVPFWRRLAVRVLCLLTAGSAMAQSAGSDPVASSAPGPDAVPRHGAIGVGSWNAAVEFSNIVVTSNNVVLYRSDFEKQGTNGWTMLNGEWSVKDGVLRQSAIQAQCRAVFGDTNWSNYTITLRARRLGGEEGFDVYFNCLDPQNWTWFNFAGWTNTLASIDQDAGGPWIQMCERVPAVIQTNVWYDVRVVLADARVECYVNSKLVEKATYSNSPAAPIATPGEKLGRPDVFFYRSTSPAAPSAWAPT